MEHIVTADFVVFPNLVKKGVNVYLDISGFETQKEVLVIVYNILSEDQYSKVVLTSDNGNAIEAIDTEKRLSKGTYLIVGTSDDKIYKRKLVIQ